MLVRNGETKQFTKSVLSEDIYVEVGGTLILTDCDSSRITIYTAGTVRCLGNSKVGSVLGHNGVGGNLIFG